MKNIIEINDSKIITEILNRAFMTVAKQYNFTKENAPTFPAFINSDRIDASLNNGLKMYGYKTNNQIIGCVGYSYYKDQIYFIERLATLPEYRHSGIGKSLMEYAEDRIKDIGGKIAEIHVVDKNATLREWYKKLYYVEMRIEEIKTLPFNSCVMNKELEK
ncbi:MAG: GNAT family N-acetyltransferase [Treponema sp.]|jgi:N-acetylglutamate synthase-like GNAT family acetyltransferase|nr:GNAT family N-acetyltransferase [Treponema sp.]